MIRLLRSISSAKIWMAHHPGVPPIISFVSAFGSASAQAGTEWKMRRQLENPIESRWSERRDWPQLGCALQFSLVRLDSGSLLSSWRWWRGGGGTGRSLLPSSPSLSAWLHCRKFYVRCPSGLCHPRVYSSNIQIIEREKKIPNWIYLYNYSSKSICSLFLAALHCVENPALPAVSGHQTGDVGSIGRGEAPVAPVGAAPPSRCHRRGSGAGGPGRTVARPAIFNFRKLNASNSWNNDAIQETILTNLCVNFWLAAPPKLINKWINQWKPNRISRDNLIGVECRRDIYPQLRSAVGFDPSPTEKGKEEAEGGAEGVGWRVERRVERRRKRKVDGI